MRRAHDEHLLLIREVNITQHIVVRLEMRINFVIDAFVWAVWCIAVATKCLASLFQFCFARLAFYHCELVAR